jgi:hypothetical protein
MEVETERVMQTWKELGGADFANKPARYERIAQEEEDFFDTLFPTVSAKEKATSILSDFGFHRSPQLKDRFPYTFIHTDAEDDGAAHIVYTPDALRKDAIDLKRATDKLLAAWGEKEGVLDALSIKQKIRDYITFASRNFFTHQAIVYGEAALKMFGSKQKRIQTEFFLTRQAALLKHMEDYNETAQINLLPEKEGQDKKRLIRSLKGKRLLFVGHLKTVSLT